MPVDLRPLSVGEVLDVAIKIYWRNAATLLLLVALVIAPAQLVVSVVYVSAIPDYERSIFSTPTAEPAGELALEREFWVSVAAAVVGGVVVFLASILATAACFKAIAEAYLGAPPHWGSSLRFALRRIHSVVWITILGAVLIGLGLVLLIVPGVWLWISFAVAVPVLLTEGLKGRRALARSWRLVRGRWWPTFGIVLLGTILASIASAVVGGLLEAARLSELAQETVAAVALDAVGNTIAVTLTTPFTAAFVTVVYFDLRVRKEAFDLRLLAERIGVEPQPEWDRAPLPPSPGGPPAAGGGDQPPYWPPPPGWRPRAGGE